jgi:two-component system, cell cycle sensor histidine kinase and response regulator CckA
MLYSAALSSLPSKPPVLRTVLLVEDEPFVREATRSILENAGLSVLAAENAEDAIRIYEKCEGTIDLVMTDMVLPGSTGEKLGQELRKRSQQLSVLVTSGYSDAEYDIEDPAAQTYFLAKPYSRGELLGKIGFILGKQAAQRAAMQAS